MSVIKLISLHRSSVALQFTFGFSSCFCFFTRHHRCVANKGYIFISVSRNRLHRGFTMEWPYVLSEHSWMAPSIRRAIGLSALFAVVNSYVEFPSSCIGEDDGYQWIKPLEGDAFPAINQKCDGEFMIIDINRDENVKAYFSSFDSWHYALSGISTLTRSDHNALNTMH